MTDQLHDQDVPSIAETTPAAKQRRPYARPELVQYGALQEVTRDYIQTRNCPTGCFVTG